MWDIDSKFETLSNAKFSICYENAKDITGYITEKIFDCFFAGCIPVYWGISNPSDVFGDGTFIDRRKFNSHEDLLNYLKNISEEEYTEIQENILKFCFNEKMESFPIISLLSRSVNKSYEQSKYTNFN